MENVVAQGSGGPRAGGRARPGRAGARAACRGAAAAAHLVHQVGVELQAGGVRRGVGVMCRCNPKCAGAWQRAATAAAPACTRACTCKHCKVCHHDTSLHAPPTCLSQGLKRLLVTNSRLPSKLHPYNSSGQGLWILVTGQRKGGGRLHPLPRPRQPRPRFALQRVP